MAEPLDDVIRENAKGPKRAKGDSGEVEQHGLKDQIDADRYLRSRDAARVGLGIKRTRVIPPGSTGQ